MTTLFALLVGLNEYDPSSMGMLVRDKFTRAREVRDGLSNTFMLVEDGGRPQLYQNGSIAVGTATNPRWADWDLKITIGAICNGRVLDWNYSRIARRLGVTVDRKRGDDLRNFPIERTRLQPVFFAQALQVAVLLPYGWALDKHASLAVPLVLQFIMGFCLVVASKTKFVQDPQRRFVPCPHG